MVQLRLPRLDERSLTGGYKNLPDRCCACGCFVLWHLRSSRALILPLLPFLYTGKGKRTRMATGQGRRAPAALLFRHICSS